MDINTNATVSQLVKTAKVRSLTFRSTAAGLTITAPFVWLDDKGKVLKVGTNTYTEAQLVEAFAGTDITGTLTALKNALSPVEACKILLLDLSGAVQKTTVVGPNADGKYVATVLTQDQLSAAIAPVTIEQLQGMISLFASSEVVK